MKRKIRRQPLGHRRIDAALGVTDRQACGRRLAVFVENAKSDDMCRLAIEDDIHLVAETEILRPLADVERNLRFALARIAAVKLDDAVFERQSPERLSERLGVEQ